jgi:hypothetical protein
MGEVIPLKASVGKLYVKGVEYLSSGSSLLLCMLTVSYNQCS